ELRRRRQHVSRPAIDVNVVGWLDLTLVDTECLMVEMEHPHAVPLERRLQLFLAPCRNLKGDPAGVRVMPRTKLRVHPRRQLGDGLVRVVFLGVCDANLVLLGRLAWGRHLLILASTARFRNALYRTRLPSSCSRLSISPDKLPTPGLAAALVVSGTIRVHL